MVNAVTQAPAQSPAREHVAPPMGLIAELTHRCPLQCPYCSNPLALEPASAELDTAGWIRVMDQAAAMGVLQMHFTGGEPMARRDHVALVRHAVSLGLYTNLITSGVTLDDRAMAALMQAGIDHIQLSFQDIDPGGERPHRCSSRRLHQEACGGLADT